MSTTPLNLDTATKYVSQAFVPYGCVASANPDEDSFGFTVIDSEGGELLNVPSVERADYADGERLSKVISQARESLEDKGCRLEPWTPGLADDTGVPEITPNY
ncbi:hypothetical protein HKW98_05640 [Stutzerimonas urumqiensis]|uniref:hypothetical protein n=1 Tax=Stutzerimonas urumqiensis TaxID=638269 RepID=UPI000EB53891|nr:hypothetical protein [Stutzerimonas urumqiensis]